MNKQSRNLRLLIGILLFGLNISVLSPLSHAGPFEPGAMESRHFYYTSGWRGLNNSSYVSMFKFYVRRISRHLKGLRFSALAHGIYIPDGKFTNHLFLRGSVYKKVPTAGSGDKWREREKYSRFLLDNSPGECRSYVSKHIVQSYMEEIFDDLYRRGVINDYEIAYIKDPDCGEAVSRSGAMRVKVWYHYWEYIGK